MKALFLIVWLSALLTTGLASGQEIIEGRLIWNRWVSWEEVRTGEAPHDSEVISDPWIYDWKRPKDQSINHTGAYWYRLAPLAPGPYQLALDYLNHGYTAWLWNIEEPARRITFSVGREGRDANSELANAVKRIVSFHSHTAGSWILVINFSFTGRASGGLWSPPRIAAGTTLEQEKFLHLSLVYATSGSLIIMLLYMIMMFVRRRSDYASLLLGLLCLGIFLRIIGVELILCELFPEARTSTLYFFSRRMEYFSFGLVTLSYLNFITQTFKSVRRLKNLEHALNAFCVIYMLDCCFTSFDSLRHHVHYLQVLTPLCLVYTIWLLIQAAKQREEGSTYMLAASVIPFAVMVGEIILSRLGSGIRLGHFAGTFFIFLQSQLLAKRFASAYSRAAQLSRSLQTEVEKQTGQIRHIMDHIPEGLFVIGRDKTITPPYSRFLSQIVPDADLSLNIIEIFSKHFSLSSQDLAMLDSVLEASLHEDAINWEFNSEHMSKTVLYREGRIYRLYWHPIIENNRILQFMGILHEVTELARLEAETREQEEEFDILREFIRTPRDRMNDFLQMQERLMKLIVAEQRKAQDLHVQQNIFSYLHTLKGNSRQLHLKALSQLCHETESPMRAALEKGEVLDAEELDRNLSRLEVKLKHYSKVFEHFFSTEDNTLTPQFNATETAGIRSWLRSNPGLPEPVRNLINRNLAPSLGDRLESVAAEILNLAPGLGKAVPTFMVEGEVDAACPDDLLPVLLDAMGHLLRNALVHGIGHEQGSVRVRIMGLHGIECLHITDSGRGLDTGRMLRKAYEQGLIDPRKPVRFHELESLMFSPTFSTAEQLSQLAGRGVGMNAVRLLLKPFHSSVSIEPLDARVARMEDVRQLAFIPFRTVITIPRDELQPPLAQGA